MLSFLILILFFHQFEIISSTIHKIGVIHSVSLIMSNINSSTMNGTCDECLCAMLLNSTSISAFNCFRTNKTCEIFSNALELGSFSLMVNLTSSFYFFPSLIYRITSTTGHITQNTISITSGTSMTTTSTSLSSSLWSFDNNTLDSLSIFHGVGINSPTYRTPGIDGYRSALSVNRIIGQFVEVSTYRNLSYTSFTVEMWFYCTVLSSSDYALFGQHHAQATDQSLHFALRNYLLHMGFWSNDLSGVTIIQTNTWYHAAFVYDYSSSTQTIYLNGRLDGTRSSPPYQGTSGSIVIGKTKHSPGTPDSFSGYIDEVSLVMRAKNSSEILDDATLVTWHSFDNVGSYYDSGPLNLTITAVNVTSVSGRVNQAISFTSNLSYYQIGGFVLLGVSNYSYSIALWVYPFSINGSILVHLSTTTNGQGWCIELMGFSSSGQIVTACWNNSLQQVIGPILPVNVWTHVASTYSLTNGLRLYVNGTLIDSTGPMMYVASGEVNILTLANHQPDNQTHGGNSCVSESIVHNVYYGSLDEFRVYSRELNITDIYKLANP